MLGTSTPCNLHLPHTLYIPRIDSLFCFYCHVSSHSLFIWHFQCLILSFCALGVHWRKCDDQPTSTEGGTTTLSIVVASVITSPPKCRHAPMSSSVASSQWSGTSHRALRCSPSWILRQLCMRSAKDARQQGVAITTRRPCGVTSIQKPQSAYTPSPSPFLRSSQPASGKGCCVVRFYFGKVQSSGFLGVRNNRCLFLLLRFNYLAGKDKEMTHFGDQLRERREVYSALLLDWFTDDPSLVDWITIASFLYL